MTPAQHQWFIDQFTKDGGYFTVRAFWLNEETEERLEKLMNSADPAGRLCTRLFCKIMEALLPPSQAWCISCNTPLDNRARQPVAVIMVVTDRVDGVGMVQPVCPACAPDQSALRQLAQRVIEELPGTHQMIVSPSGRA
jgi:hypothetical protein